MTAKMFIPKIYLKTKEDRKDKKNIRRLRQSERRSARLRSTGKEKIQQWARAG
jgi:hypothetical protein